METTLFQTDEPSGLADALEAAVAALSRGEVVALPTETVYGLGADATDEAAVLKIFEAKERPFFDPLIVHLPSREWLERLAVVGEEERPLVEVLTAAFWPGPLTLVLPRRALVPDLVASGLPTVALRMSAHPVFSAIVERLGKPLAAPSANRFGRISPTAARHAMEELGGRIPLVIDGGPTTHGVESTIVALHGGQMEILRSGPVTREELLRFGPVVEAGVVAKPIAPGQLKSHYAPGTPLFFLGNEAVGEPAESGLLAWREGRDGFAQVEVLSPSGDLREAAMRLFSAMRRLDDAGLKAIYVEPVPESGLGVAIMDRLRRAAWREGEA